MNILGKVRAVLGRKREANRLLLELVQGIANQSRLFNDKTKEIILALNNQQRMLNEKLGGLTEGSNNQSRMLNDKLAEIIAGVANHSSNVNDKLTAMIELQNEQINLQRAQIETVRAMQKPVDAHRQTSEDDGTAGLQKAMQQLPLMLDRKTYNSAHPDYDAKLVRNYPGRIFNANHACSNAVYTEIKKLMSCNDKVPDQVWKTILSDALEEVRAAPHARQMFERQNLVEQYIAELNRKYQAHYAPGWVNLDDALFLYWLVRHLKPRTILQTGVCNGLSTAFMMLALVNNGPHGKLRAIDLPPVFTPNDPAWAIRDKVYGVVIPEGRWSGWMVPDAYRDRFEVWNGDAKILLPKLVDEIDAIDMFYHDSDHTYDHMMFEFREVKRRLAAGGLIVADDVAWNAALWDFSDSCGVPAYNFKGSVGVAFF